MAILAAGATIPIDEAAILLGIGESLLRIESSRIRPAKPFSRRW
jgi:hypothetical protein